MTDSLYPHAAILDAIFTQPNFYKNLPRHAAEHNSDKRTPWPTEAQRRTISESNDRNQGVK